MQEFLEISKQLKTNNNGLKSVFRVKSAIAAAMAACLLTTAGCSESVFGDPASGGGSQNNTITDDSNQSSADSASQDSAETENPDSSTDEAKNGSEAENGTEGVNEAENTDSDSASEANGSASAEDSGEASEESSETAPITDESDKPANTQDGTALYEKFLNNEITVLVKNDANMGEYWKPSNLMNMDVTLEGLVKGIISYYTDDDPTIQMEVEGIDYAYIDCGNDGNKELALRISTPMGTEYFQEYVVIKAVDGILETIYSNVSWTRSSFYLGEYGYIYGDGSGGAAYHIFDKSFLDADGTWHFLYKDSSTDGITPDSSVYINGESYTIPAKTKLDGDYVLLQFDFNNTEMDETDDLVTYAKTKAGDQSDDIWENGFKGYFYADLEADASIYEDSNPLKKLFDKEGLKVYTLDEIDQMIADKEASEGLTEEVKNGAVADWQPLSYNF